MVIPVWKAPSAGIASVSIVVFGSLLLAGLILLKRDSSRVLYIALGVSLLSCLIPQLFFIHSASKYGAALSFNPSSYLHFSGKTDILPSQIVKYKTVDSHSLNLALYSTKTKTNRPAVILFHGGAWRYGNYLETGKWPLLLTEAGYTVISVEYRLSNDAYNSWNDTPVDALDALRYVQKHAEELSVDPSRIHLMGQSAGGHLALLAAYTSSDVKSVVSLYAPTDLIFDYNTSRDKNAELDFIGGSPEMFPERYEQLSPIHRVDSFSPPTLIIQGEVDDLVHPRNAALLAEALTAVNVPHESVLIPLTGHSFDNQRGSFATQIAEQTILRFLSY